MKPGIFSLDHIILTSSRKARFKIIIKMHKKIKTSRRLKGFFLKKLKGKPKHQQVRNTTLKPVTAYKP